MVSDAAVYLPLALVLAPGAPLLAGAVAVAFALTEFAGVLGAAAGGARRYDGPFGKSDRAAYFSLLAVVVAAVHAGGVAAGRRIRGRALLALVTTANRLRAAFAGPRHG